MDYIEVANKIYTNYSKEFITDFTRRHIYVVNKYGMYNWYDDNNINIKLRKIIRKYDVTSNYQIGCVLIELKKIICQKQTYHFNNYIICYENGVFDLLISKFRSVLKEEKYIVDIEKMFSESTIELVNDNIKLLRTIYNDTLYEFATAVYKLITNKVTFIILHGSYSSGKSTVQQMIYNAFNGRFTVIDNDNKNEHIRNSIYIEHTHNLYNKDVYKEVCDGKYDYSFLPAIMSILNNN